MKRAMLWNRAFGAALIIAGLMLAAPAVWAIPDEAPPAQTVPTRTPRPSPAPTQPPQPTTQPQPTSEPAPSTPAPPSATPASATATPGPSATVEPSATPTPGPATLALTKEVYPTWAMPGASLHYTLTLVNRGTTSLRDLLLTDTLPEGMTPGVFTSGLAGVWEGRTLRLAAAVLPPEGRLVVAYRAAIAQDVAWGRVLVNRAQANAAGGLQATATAQVSLPPAELPPTGCGAGG